MDQAFGVGGVDVDQLVETLDPGVDAIALAGNGQPVRDGLRQRRSFTPSSAGSDICVIMGNDEAPWPGCDISMVSSGSFCRFFHGLNSRVCWTPVKALQRLWQDARQVDHHW